MISSALRDNSPDAVAKGRRVLFVLIDGLADVAVDSLGGLTPLEFAKLPTIDAMAGSAVGLGLMDPVEPGLACGSDTAHLSILGYDPRKVYRGRGAFESMGAGIKMQPGDIAFKANFATMLAGTETVLLRRAARNFEGEGPSLCESLNGISIPGFPEIDVFVQYATEHRCGVCLKGPGLSDNVIGTDPLVDGRPLRVCTGHERTAAIVNALSLEFRSKLASHPINLERIRQGKNPADVLLLRGCGSRIDIEQFSEKTGMNSFMIAPTKIVQGIGITAGFDIIQVPGASGDYYTDFNAKASYAVDLLTNAHYDFGFLHVKAVDDAGHDNDAHLKVKFLEEVDKMLHRILAGLCRDTKEYGLILTGDHSTPVLYGDHSCEPVPFMAAPCINPDIEGQTTVSFNEISVAQGNLGRFPGSEVQSLIKEFRLLGHTSKSTLEGLSNGSNAPL